MQNLCTRALDLVGRTKTRASTRSSFSRDPSTRARAERISACPDDRPVLGSVRPIAQGWPRNCRWTKLGGPVQPVHNPIEVMELAMEKGGGMVLLPVSCRRALIDLSDDVATRVQAFFYLNAIDALRKALNET